MQRHSHAPTSQYTEIPETARDGQKETDTDSLADSRWRRMRYRYSLPSTMTIDKYTLNDQQLVIVLVLVVIAYDSVLVWLCDCVTVSQCDSVTV